MSANPAQGIKQLNPLRRIVSPTMKNSLTNPALGLGILILKTLEFAGAGLGYLVGTKKTLAICSQTSRKRGLG